jgi:signal transduction histidine kinase/ligand-binding sensor domain-containing protein
MDYKQYPQNWAVTQDHRGIVYVGNNNGVLEYDGEHWRLIPTANNTFVRSLAADETDGTVYVGTVGDFGYLKPDSIGVMRYVSLHEKIPAVHESFKDIWGTHATSEFAYFQANARLFRWDGTSVDVWTSEDGFHTSFVVRDDLYVRDFQHGLLKMVDDSLQLAPAGERFEDTPVHLMLPFPDGQTLIGTSQDGLFLYDGQTLTPFPTEADPFLEENKLYHGTLLSNGSVALATMGGGVIVIDQSGRLVRVLGPAAEVPDGVINYVHEDREGGLWMALNNSGLARAEVVSPLTKYDNSLGLEGVIYGIERHRSELYVATGAGLFVLNTKPLTPQARQRGERTAFRRIDGVPISWDVQSMQEGLLVATDSGIFLLKENGQERLTRGVNHTARTITASDRHPGRYYVGGRQGVTVLRRTEDDWQVNIVPGIREEIHTIVEAEDEVLWLSTVDGDIMRVQLAGEGSAKPAIHRFKNRGGLPEGFSRVASVAGDVVILSREGVFSVEQQAGMNQAEPTEASPPFRFVQDDRFRIDSNDDPLLGLVKPQVGDLWMLRGSRVYRGRLRSGPMYDWTEVEALRFPKSEVSSVFVDTDGVLWMGRHRTLIRFDPNGGDVPQGPFEAFIRQVSTLGDRDVLYGGARMDSSAAVPSARRWNRIRYDQNDLRFDFAAPRFGNFTPLEYQYRLAGLDSGWSEWQENTNVVYSDLAEGQYTFHVRARAGEDVVSEAAAFSFGVLPPWYRTWWAYGMYLVVLAVLGGGYRRHRRVVKENERARAQVKELERERLANERLQEANQRLKQANELKDNFLANTSHELRTPLTTILGFTDVLKEEAPGHHREFLDIIEKSGQRLLRTLNALLDLAKLRSGVVDANLKRIDVVDKAAETLEMVAHEAQQKDIELDLEAPDHPVYAKLDERYYEQVLDNLISNAIKFTDEGGVRVSVEQTAEQVHIGIHDTGTGIDESFIPYLFDDFKQESSGLDRDHSGSGLGLAISARLVKLMHGTIDVHSTKGRGSTFKITFPRDAGAVPAEVSDADPVRLEQLS